MANNRKFHNFCANVPWIFEVFWNGCPSFIICELNRSETSIPSDQGKQEDSYSPSVLPPPKKMDHWYVPIQICIYGTESFIKKTIFYTQWIVTVKWSWFWDIFIIRWPDSNILPPTITGVLYPEHYTYKHYIWIIHQTNIMSL